MPYLSENRRAYSGDSNAKVANAHGVPTRPNQLSAQCAAKSNVSVTNLTKMSFVTIVGNFHASVHVMIVGIFHANAPVMIVGIFHASARALSAVSTTMSARVPEESAT